MINGYFDNPFNILLYRLIKFKLISQFSFLMFKNVFIKMYIPRMYLYYLYLTIDDVVCSVREEDIRPSK